MWGNFPYIERNRELWEAAVPGASQWDPHLRSTDNVTGYHIEALDGEIGHVSDFIIDAETWAIRYLVIDTRNWWPGKSVLISPQWIKSISWSETKVLVNVTRETISQSPKFDVKAPLTREFEEALHKHYQVHGYWETESGKQKNPFLA